MLRHSTPASVLLVLSAIAWNAACASTGRIWSQETPSVRRGTATPGSLERIERLRPGAPLVVTVKTGERLEGAFNAVDPSVLALIDRTGKERRVPIPEIVRIVGPPARDSLANGAAIGAGVGLGAALAILGALASQDGYVLHSAKVGAPLLLSGAGAMVGLLIDRAHERAEVLYVAR